MGGCDDDLLSTPPSKMKTNYECGTTDEMELFGISAGPAIEVCQVEDMQFYDSAIYPKAMSCFKRSTS